AKRIGQGTNVPRRHQQSVDAVAHSLRRAPTAFATTEMLDAIASRTPRGRPSVDTEGFLPPYSPHLNPDEQVWAHLTAKLTSRRRGQPGRDEACRCDRT